MDSREAAAAVAAIEGAEARLAEQIGACPPWRHAAFGLIIAVMVGSLALPLPLQSAGTAIGLALVAIVVSYDRRRYGVFINGYRRGRTLPLTMLLLVVTLAMMVAQLCVRWRGLPGWESVALAALAFVFGTGASVVWQGVFLRELKAGRR
jgi:hypothetical protein